MFPFEIYIGYTAHAILRYLPNFRDEKSLTGHPACYAISQDTILNGLLPKILSSNLYMKSSFMLKIILNMFYIYLETLHVKKCQNIFKKCQYTYIKNKTFIFPIDISVFSKTFGDLIKQRKM